MVKPRWDETQARWIVQPMKDGKRKTFTSMIPGIKGKKEVMRQVEAFEMGEGSCSKKTVARVASEYLEDVGERNGKKSGSYIQNRGYINLYIVPACGSKKIGKMTLRDWQNVINGACGENGEPLSHKTLCNLRSIIMGIIKYGYTDYQCEMPRGDLYIPKGRSKSEKEILQKPDIARLLESSDLWYHPAFCLMVLTGLRPGEALGIQVADIDYENDTIHITRAVNSSGIITDGKNDNARRIVPLSNMARKILTDTIKRNEACGRRSKWVFCGVNGGMGNQSTMHKQWRRLKEERDLPGSVYSLRHTFISMTKDVLPESTLKDIVGHSVSMDTYKTYGHIVDGESKKAAEIIDLTFDDAKIANQK